jgi:methionyl aminopeptidase
VGFSQEKDINAIGGQGKGNLKGLDKLLPMEEMPAEATIEEFAEVGKIAARIREESKQLVNAGEGLLDIAETIEGMIREQGCDPAFPTNVSVNEIAAHYTPEQGDKTLLGEKDIVKVDLGVEMNGAIADTAYTIDLSGNYAKLVEASEKALEMAIAAIKPGVTVGHIGGVIEDAIKGYGYRPVANLTGHRISTGMLHTGIDVPCVKSEDPYEFQVGEIYAIEPFATNGKGFVSDSDQVEIFSLYMPGALRLRESRKILQTVIEKYGMLPFAERWLMEDFKSRLLLKNGLKEMLRMQVLKAYPVLKEIEGGLVSQAEHTIVIEENGARILTKE